MGYTISQALTSGFQRGMFSNEAGMGSSPNAAAAAASWPPHPAAQGIVQMIGVFIDTIVICTASAIIVMLAPRPDNEYTLNGIQDLQHAMSVLVGGWGAGFIALIVLLFAFSSIVANYVYAENNLVFLRLDKPRYIWGLRILTVLMVLLGTMVSLACRLAERGYHHGADGDDQPDGHSVALPDGADYRQRLSASAAAGYPADFRCHSLPGY